MPPDVGFRNLVGLPARHGLIPGSLHADDPESTPRLAGFVLGYADDSDKAIDRGAFELREGPLVLFDLGPPQ